MVGTPAWLSSVLLGLRWLFQVTVFCVFRTHLVADTYAAVS